MAQPTRKELILTSTVLVLAMVAIGVVLIRRADEPQNSNETTIASFADCAKAGLPVMESYPHQCRAPDGTVYVEEDDEPVIVPQTSLKGIVLEVDAPESGQVIGSPLEISGKVPGSWAFEASFPIELLDESGEVIATTSAQINGDWMTEELVSFTATIAFTDQPAGPGSLVLRKANPSDLEENADSFELPILFKNGD